MLQRFKQTLVLVAIAGAPLLGCATQQSEIEAKVDRQFEATYQSVMMPISKAMAEACPKFIKMNPETLNDFNAALAAQSPMERAEYNKTYRETLAKMRADRTVCTKLSNNRDAFKDSPMNSRYIVWIQS